VKSKEPAAPATELQLPSLYKPLFTRDKTWSFSGQYTFWKNGRRTLGEAIM
jgi:hypothetical protein